MTAASALPGTSSTDPYDGLSRIRSRLTLTRYISPGKPISTRLRTTRCPYLAGLLVAPTTITELGPIRISKGSRAGFDRAHHVLSGSARKGSRPHIVRSLMLRSFVLCGFDRRHCLSSCTNFQEHRTLRVGRMPVKRPGPSGHNGTGRLHCPAPTPYGTVCAPICAGRLAIRLQGPRIWFPLPKSGAMLIRARARTRARTATCH